ncbi:MAG: phosphate acyltransferase PlsX [Caldiserica bacterium]|jgi:glycerol-3-phosphate acyltransferase PlsX|nr:phosphate acyltransferase PlsX [Caldisericota bacterium]MDH7562907.1 phosphate acyltransferase PlsX [Caldisericota bacterium]
MSFRLALDAMGGDYAPEEILKGIQEYQGEKCEFLLVGPQGILEKELSVISLKGKDFSLVPAEEIVSMNEVPSLSLRKKNSTIQVGLRLVAENEANAFISAGNTGAIMAASIIILGTLPGLKRPPLAVPLPGKTRPVLLLDAGANVDCSPQQLLQFALLADQYYRLSFGIESPRIALLSNGEEPSKGNSLIKEAFPLFEKSSLNFVGNLEARDFFSQKGEIFVADGFPGNIALKAMEGVGEEILSRLKQGISRNLRFKLGGLLLKPLFSSILKGFDYSEVGAAPLLGINGLVLVCHGRSRARAIKNSITQAIELLEKNTVGKLKDLLEKDSQGGEMTNG